MPRRTKDEQGAARPASAIPKAASPDENVINALEDSFQHPKQDKRRQRRHIVTPTSLESLRSDGELNVIDTKMQRPLLIIAIGNKGARYDNTYHSAGIVLMQALRRLEMPKNWELWESTHLMNDSGSFVKKRLSRWDAYRRGGSVVILQDELDREMGKISVRKGWSSARGHNGIKSIQQSMPRDMEWFRISIGIGRPASRDSTEVANYVLAKMKPEEKEMILEKAHDVMEELRDISGSNSQPE